MNNRVVITGLGICAPNGVDIASFTHALKNGISGISFHENLAALEFGCQIGGEPAITKELLAHYFTPLQLRGLKATGIMYGVIAGVDAWKDAQLPIENKAQPAWENGIIFGTGILGVDQFREAIHLIDAKNTRRLGSTSVMQTMASGISA